jgi:hypothetical protein
MDTVSKIERVERVSANGSSEFSPCTREGPRSQVGTTHEIDCFRHPRPRLGQGVALLATVRTQTSFAEVVASFEIINEEMERRDYKSRLIASAYPSSWSGQAGGARAGP